MNTRFRHLVMTCLLLGGLLLGTRAAFPHQESPPSPTRGRIVFGGDQEFPPFEFLSSGGTPAGFHIDLIRAIARTQEFDVEIVLGPWDQIIQKFRDGSIDVVGLFQQPEREAYADFCDPHTVSGSEVFHRIRTDEITSIADLQGKEVIVQGGALAEEHLNAQRIGATLIRVSTESDAIRLLASGQHDYAIVTQFGGRSAMKRLKLTNLTTSGPVILASNYCLAVGDGNTALRESMNQGLAILKQTGEYNQLFDRWLGDFEPTSRLIRVLRALAVWLVFPLLLLALGSVLWSRTLRRQVRLRTGQLSRELSERAEAQAALQESEQRYRTLTEQAPEAIVVIDVDGRRLVDANENATWLFKLDRAALLQNDPMVTLADSRPDGSLDTGRLETLLQRALTGETVLAELTIRDAMTQRIPCEVRLVRIMLKGRWIVRASLTDITERKRAEAREHVMRSELDHRVRNTLASICGLADRMLFDRPSPEEFRRAFLERVHAMARSHEALASAKWEGVRLSRALDLMTSPLSGPLGDRAFFEGADPVLPAAVSTPTCMVLHELADNAGQYGGLKFPGGSVRITSRVDASEMLRIEWREFSPGFDASAGLKPGLGLSLVRGLVEFQLRGSMECRLGAQGFECDLAFNISRDFWDIKKPDFRSPTP